MQQTTPKHTTKLKHRTHIQNGCDHGDVNVHTAATISCPAIIIVILTSTTEHQTAIVEVPLRYECRKHTTQMNVNSHENHRFEGLSIIAAAAAAAAFTF